MPLSPGHLVVAALVLAGSKPGPAVSNGLPGPHGRFGPRSL